MGEARLSKCGPLWDFVWYFYQADSKAAFFIFLNKGGNQKKMTKIYTVEQLTPEIIEESVTETIHTIYNSLSWTLHNEFLVKFEPLKNFKNAPLHRTLMDIFNYATTNRIDRSYAYECVQTICELLFSAPGTSSYSIPESFWHTPLGYACRCVLMGIENDATDDTISSADVCKILGISRAGVTRVAEQLGGRKSGNRWLFNRQKVLEYKKKRAEAKKGKEGSK
jgi:hypothetical protein